MPFAIMLMSPPERPAMVEIRREMEALVRVQGGRVLPTGDVETGDGATLQVQNDTIWTTNGLSPGSCRLIFDTAVRTSTYVNTGGSDVTPIRVKGGAASTPPELGRPVVALDAEALCSRLKRRARDWHRFIVRAQAEGFMDREEKLIQAPGALGDEKRLETDGTGVARRCEAAGRSMARRLKWRVLTEVTSQSAKWGVVWRADIGEGDDPTTWTRFTCHRSPAKGRPRGLWLATQPLLMFDAAQSLKPLAEEPPR